MLYILLRLGKLAPVIQLKKSETQSETLSVVCPTNESKDYSEKPAKKKICSKTVKEQRDLAIDQES